MKRLFPFILFILFILSAQAQTPVQFNLLSYTTSGQNRTITATPAVTPLVWRSNVVWASAVTIHPTNGTAIQNLVPGQYTLTLDGVPGSWTIFVPDTNTTQQAWLIGSNLTGFAYSPLIPPGLVTNGQNGVSFGSAQLPNATLSGATLTAPAITNTVMGGSTIIGAASIFSSSSSVFTLGGAGGGNSYETFDSQNGISFNAPGYGSYSFFSAPIRALGGLIVPGGAGATFTNSAVPAPILKAYTSTGVPQMAINSDGSITAVVGSTNLVGTVPIGLIPSYVLTNQEPGVSLAGAFSGNHTGVHAGSAELGRSFVVAQSNYYRGFPGMTMLSNGTLYAVYRRALSHAADNGVIVSVTSTNQGQTWSSESVILSTNTDVRDPSITLLTNGNLLLTSFMYNTNTAVQGPAFTMLSSNQGTTWSAPSWITYFSTGQALSAPAIQLQNGTLLLPVYGYSGVTYALSCVVMQSGNGGTNWSYLSTIALSGTYGKNFSEPNIMQMSNGQILAICRNETDLTATTAISSDNGATWNNFTLDAFPCASRCSMVTLPDSSLLLIYRSGNPNINLTYRPSLRVIAGNGLYIGAESLLDMDETWYSFEYGSPVSILPGLIGVIYSTSPSASQADMFFRYLSPGESVGRQSSIIARGGWFNGLLSADVGIFQTKVDASAISIGGSNYVGAAAPPNGLSVQGNVGVGTIPLSVPWGSTVAIGDANFPDLMLDSTNGGGEWHLLGDNGGGLSFRERSGAGYSNVVQFSASGAVGISTNQPHAALEVNGAAQIDGPISVLGVNGGLTITDGGGAGKQSLTLSSTAGSAPGSWSIWRDPSAGGGGNLFIGPSLTSPYLSIPPNLPVLGIGTANPASVWGSTLDLGGINFADLMEVSTNGGSEWHLRADNGGDLSVLHKVGATYSNSITFSHLGSVGIGTNVPNAFLEVAGTEMVDGLMTLSGGVFVNGSYLGILTNSPHAPLEVAGAAQIDGSLSVSNITSPGGTLNVPGVNGGINIADGGLGGRQVLALTATGGSSPYNWSIWNDPSSTGAGNLYIGPSNGAPFLTIQKTTGNVGIGGNLAVSGNLTVGGTATAVTIDDSGSLWTGGLNVTNTAGVNVSNNVTAGGTVAAALLAGNGSGVTNVPFTINVPVYNSSVWAVGNLYFNSAGQYNGTLTPGSPEARAYGRFFGPGPNGAWVSNMWVSCLGTNLQTTWGGPGTNMTFLAKTNSVATLMSPILQCNTTYFTTNDAAAAHAFYMSNGTELHFAMTPNATIAAPSLWWISLVCYPQ